MGFAAGSILGSCNVGEGLPRVLAYGSLRNEWRDADLAEALAQMLGDDAMAHKLAATSAYMKACDGRRKAARRRGRPVD